MPAKVQAVTVERTPDGAIRARAWGPSAVSRIWRPVEEEVLADEASLSRWMFSVDQRYGPGSAVLLATDPHEDAPLMDAVKKGMRAP